MPRLGDRRLRTLAVMLVVGLGIVALTVVLDRGGAGYQAVTLTGDTSGSRPVVGGTAPGFRTVDTDGAAFDLASYAGQPMWLTFGASWCIDCRAEAADLIATAHRYRDRGLVVVGVFLQETPAEVNRYAERVGLDIVRVADPMTSIASRYRIMGLPTHYFIGADAIIREIRLGGLPPDEMDRLAASILE